MEKTKIKYVVKRIAQTPQPGKKTVQKLFYLIERSGVHMDLDYGIHYFGPYSGKLDYQLHTLQMQGMINVQSQGSYQVITLLDDYDCITPSEAEVNLIDRVIERFGNLPSIDLEVITTADFVARQLGQRSHDAIENDITQGVKRIKGNKFSEEKILEAIKRLRDFNLL